MFLERLTERGNAMMKRKTVDAVKLEDAKSEGKWAKPVRKASFTYTCDTIREWADAASSAYSNGREPTPQMMEWLVRLVKELGTGTRETQRITVTVGDVAKVVGLESSSMTPHIKQWGRPIIAQSGRRKASYDLMKTLPTLRQQFPDVDGDDWNALIVNASGL